nr:sigma-70 family RNA polymerase sigma factor [Kineosphaera limosa]
MTADLLARAADAPESERQVLLDEVVLLNGPVAEAIAARYRARGIESDDLLQVAYLGLVKASQGYKQGEGPAFLAYAVPTISGELKRHFRDFGWMVRPPRRLQELRAAAVNVGASLQHDLGRPATDAEVAQALDVSLSELGELELADGCYSALSLDATGPGDSTVVLADLLVDESAEYEHVEDREMLRPALEMLSDRDRKILLLRFVRGFTQEQIGNEIGVSQMQVSRLLTRILSSLRDELSEPAEVG